MQNPLVTALLRRDDMTDEEIGIVEGFGRSVRDIPAKIDIVTEGDHPDHSCLLLTGVAARYNIVGDGNRQISAIHFPGDFIDLHSFLLTEMDHSVVALSDCRIATVPHAKLKEISATAPHLTRLLWTLTVIDAAIFRQWLVAAGRRSVESQLAHLLCEFWTRLDAVNLADGYSFVLPLSQSDVSDAMGLSLVHVNRTIQSLKRRGLVEWSGQKVRIMDWKQLQHLGEFDPTYLQLKADPR
jgi:CRP-like cAMP-binding protein